MAELQLKFSGERARPTGRARCDQGEEMDENNEETQVIPGDRPWTSPGTPPWIQERRREPLLIPGRLPHAHWGYQAPPPVMVQLPSRPSSSSAVWALALGVIGLLAGWCLFALPCVAAVIVGHLALNDTKNDVKTGRGMAVTGLILGYVSLVPAVILFFWMTLGLITGTPTGLVEPFPSSY
jgi:Domain of unknown function (DUF4190)